MWYLKYILKHQVVKIRFTGFHCRSTPCYNVIVISNALKLYYDSIANAINKLVGSNFELVMFPSVVITRILN